MSELDDFDDNDPGLLQAAVGPVRRIQAEEAPAKPRPRAKPVQRFRDEEEALLESRRGDRDLVLVGDSSEYRRPETTTRTLRRLRRGLFTVQDEIDLHGLRAADAERVLRRFLSEVKAAELGCVRIVHGKGLHARDSEPVLRPLVERMLLQRGDVLAFCSAPPNQGGTGAVLVLLARRRSGEAISAD